MAFTLIQLKARLQKVIIITTDEIDQDDGACKGMYVWRDNIGEKYFWSPRPVRYCYENVETLTEADHIIFLCPKCFAKNGGSVGTHMVMVTFTGRNVPDDAGSRGKSGPTRWSASGTGLEDLVLRPSILLDESLPAEQGCHWHGFVGSNGVMPGHVE